MPNEVNLYYTFDYPRPDDGILPGGAPDGGDIVGADMSFAPLRMNTFELQTNEDTGRLHGGILYSNILDSRYSHSFYFQPRELTDSKVAFLKMFWRADFKYISLPLAGSGLNGVREVRTNGGKLPISRINENKYLKELAIELTEVEPNAD